MGKAERDKGKRAELEIAHILQAAGFDGARRTAQHCGKSGDASDVVGIPGLHIEVKRCETIRLHEWFAQAVRDASGTGSIPVVFHRRSKEKWMATLTLDDFLQIILTRFVAAGGTVGAEHTDDSEQDGYNSL